MDNNQFSVGAMTDEDRISMLREALENARDAIEAKGAFDQGDALWNIHQNICKALAATQR